MPTCRQVITSALRKLVVLDPEESLLDPQAVTGLEVLQGFYQSLVNGGAFGRLRDVLITADYVAGENELIAYSGATTAAITLPTTILDRCTGLSRAPLDHAVVAVAGSTPQTFIYDAQFGDWNAIEALTLDSYAPFSNRLQIAAPLAVLLATEYGKPVTPALNREAGQARIALLTRYPSPRRETEIQYF